MNESDLQSERAGVPWTAFIWPTVTLVYSVFEVCRPHSKWMLALWWFSVASGIAWLPMVPFLERLKLRLATAAVTVESAEPSANSDQPGAR